MGARMKSAPHRQDIRGGVGVGGELVIITIVHVFDEELNSFLESKFELLIRTRIY